MIFTAVAILLTWCAIAYPSSCIEKFNYGRNILTYLFILMLVIGYVAIFTHKIKYSNFKDTK